MDKDKEKSSKLLALHSSASPEHGTPPEYVEAARRVLGEIDLDPASSVMFNEVVKARSIYTKTEDGLKQPWKGQVFLNPPSGEEGKLVKRFWEKLMHDWKEGLVTEAIWIGFSIDQMQTLQTTSPGGPIKNDFPVCVPRSRIQFLKGVEASKQADLFSPETPQVDVIRGAAPTKPNFICHLPPNSDMHFTQRCRFLDEFEMFGEVWT